MPHRIILYDALRSLHFGHILVKAGELSLGMHLDNVPEICHVYNILAKRRYLRELFVKGQHEENLHYFTLSRRGELAFREGEAWYKRLPFSHRIWGRFGLPLPY